VALRKPYGKANRRLLSESIALAEAHGSTAFMDDDFAKDVQQELKVIANPWSHPNGIDLTPAEVRKIRAATIPAVLRSGLDRN
jgi:hypothetical protein